jgi:multiple sugar transport system permease protein
MRRPINFQRIGAPFAYHTIATGVAALFLVPLPWVVAASLRQPGLPPPRTIEWLPDPVAWSNYARIFELLPLGRYTLNSLLVVALAVPITLVVASWAGFAMAQLEARTRRRLVTLSIVLLLVPTTALWLTRFILFTQLGLVDTIWALVAPAWMGTSPFFALMFYWTFRRVPGELFDSARLDGAGLLRVWASVALPLARPTAVAVCVLAFEKYWSDFLSPLLYIKSDERYTLPVGIQILQQMDATNWPLLMAAAVVMMGPIVLMFLAAHRFFLSDGWLVGVNG